MNTTTPKQNEGNPVPLFELPKTRVLRLEAVALTLGLSKQTIWNMTESGALPRPIRLTGEADGSGAVGWIASEIEEWIIGRPRAETSGKMKLRIAAAREAGAKLKNPAPALKRAAARKAKATASEVTHA